MKMMMTMTPALEMLLLLRGCETGLKVERWSWRSYCHHHGRSPFFLSFVALGGTDCPLAGQLWMDGSTKKSWLRDAFSRIACTEPRVECIWM